MIPLAYYIGLSAIMFVLGIMGVLVRRNALVVFMSLELMFNAANLLFVAFSAYFQLLTGQVFVFFCDDGCRGRSGGWAGADGGDFPHQTQY